VQVKNSKGEMAPVSRQSGCAEYANAEVGAIKECEEKGRSENVSNRLKKERKKGKRKEREKKGKKKARKSEKKRTRSTRTVLRSPLTKLHQGPVFKSNFRSRRIFQTVLRKIKKLKF
jgi:ribosomal protein L19E